MVVDLFLVYQFLRRLATPFNEWDAYELGIIDERGNLLKKRRELRTVKERDAFGIFDLMITKIKRLIEKIPGGKSRIASYAAALYLIKEDWEHMTEEEIEASIEEYFNSLDESTDYKFELFAKMLEDAPANAMGGGNIAGGGYNGSGDVKVPPAAASKYKKKNKEDQQKFYEDCWDGYRQSGMKKKGDRMVPNCVPETKQAPTIGGVRMNKLGSKPGSYKSLVSRHLGKSAAKKIDKSDGDRLVAKGKKTGDNSLVRKGNFIKNVIAKK